jgi:hypothetical protein
LRRLAVKAYLQRLALDDKPILVGPWRSEVGFEALYWIPFLKWCAKHVDWRRFVPVTRGGAHVLWDGKFDEAVDLYSLRTVTEVRRENLWDWSRTKLQKQMRVTEWDKQVLWEAADRACGRGAKYHILHPSWMYWALGPFWDEDRGLKYLLSMTDYTPLPRPLLPKEPGLDQPMLGWLPDRFVAMKFYGRATFPWPHPDTHAFVSQISGAIASQVPIVLLNSGHAGDEHGDIHVSGPNIHKLPSVPPEQNLALQAAVLGKAIAFVGTYGGVAQLALRMGIPSCSFWSEFGGTAEAHLTLSHLLSHRLKVPFLTGSIADVQMWRQIVSLPVPVEQAA